MRKEKVKTGEMARGTLMVLQRRCGKERCRCARGEPHSTWVLSYSVKGKTHMLCLRKQDLARVKAALRRYRRALAELEREALSGIKTLREEIAREKRERR
jgi:hypothetical protein